MLTLDEFPILYSPTGQGAGGLFHICLRIMANPEREQLHQFPAQVLVGVSFPVARRVEVVEQGRSASLVVEQVAESVAGAQAQRIVLPRASGPRRALC